MEHQDIRRELAQLDVEPRSFAGIGVVAPFVSRRPGALDPSLLAGLMRWRDLAVVGLRLAGWRRFVDPELLGWFVYVGSERHRHETVFRQTVLMGLGSDADRLTDADLAALDPVMDLLTAYDRGQQSDEVARLFSLVRRAHDGTFTLPETRATLLFAALELMLGRFRPAKDRVQLEGLVGALSGLSPASAGWFAERGRALRNDVAHGSWRPRSDESRSIEEVAPPPGESDLAPLHEVVAAALTELLRLWPGAGPAPDAAGPLLVAALRARA